MKIIALLCVGLMALAQFPSLESAAAAELPCGLTNYNGEPRLANVHGIVVARPGESPFSARLVFANKSRGQHCSAVIIDQFNLLTASDCITRTTLDRLKVVYGNYDLANSTEGSREVTPAKVGPTDVSDVSLITTEQEMEFSLPAAGYGSVNKVCLAPAESNYKGPLVFHGVHSEFTELVEAQLAPVDEELCRSSGLPVSGDQICLEGATLSQESLGASLVRARSDGRWELVAVVTGVQDGLIRGSRFNN